MTIDFPVFCERVEARIMSRVRDSFLECLTQLHVIEVSFVKQDTKYETPKHHCHDLTESDYASKKESLRRVIVSLSHSPTRFGVGYLTANLGKIHQHESPR